MILKDDCLEFYDDIERHHNPGIYFQFNISIKELTVKINFKTDVSQRKNSDNSKKLLQTKHEIKTDQFYDLKAFREWQAAK